MGESTPQQRANWKRYECREADMKWIDFGPDRIKVAPPTEEAWQALATVLLAHGYDIRTGDTDSYNCRKITGGSERSLHSYGIALDVNWQTNPFKKTPNKRKVIFSSAPTQALRALDVKRDLADTDMTPAMIEDALRIATKGGKRVFEWGGNWQSVKDAMHFEIDVKPEDLAEGIDWGTVRTLDDGEEDEAEDQRGILEELLDALLGIDDDIEREAPVVAAVGEGLAFGAEGNAVKALQTALASLNYHLGDIDGKFGPLTRAAVLAFQANQGLPTTGVVDAATQAALLTAGPRPINDEREYETARDLKSKGSEIIRLSDWLRNLGLSTGVLGAIGISEGQLDLVTGVLGTYTDVDTPALTEAEAAAGGTVIGGTAGSIISVIDALITTPTGLGIVVLGAGLLFWRNSRQIVASRLEEHRTGSNLGL